MSRQLHYVSSQRHSAIVCSFSQAIVALNHKGGHSFLSHTWWRLSHIKKCFISNLTYQCIQFTEEHTCHRDLFYSPNMWSTTLSYARPFCDQIIILQRSANYGDLLRGPNSVSLLWRIISQGLHWPFPWNHLGQGDPIHPKSFFFNKI